jgi:hypothetical protein
MYRWITEGQKIQTENERKKKRKFREKHREQGLGEVVHTCNPSYSRRYRLRGSQLETSPGKKVSWTPLQPTSWA